MKMKNKGFGILILIIAIFVIVAGLGGVYIVKNIDKQDTPENIGIKFDVDDSENSRLSKAENADIVKSEKSSIPLIQNDDIVASLSEGGKDVFEDQYGIIKSATNVGKNQWILAVDLVTRNSKWLPGIGKEPFFINQNPKIRNLNITTETKAYHLCSGPEGKPVNIEVFMQDLQKTMERNLEVAREVARIFDITGHDIVNIYSSCVP